MCMFVKHNIDNNREDGAGKEISRKDLKYKNLTTEMQHL
jgi:hypothetical protein